MWNGCKITIVILNQILRIFQLLYTTELGNGFYHFKQTFENCPIAVLHVTREQAGEIRSMSKFSILCK